MVLALQVLRLGNHRPCQTQPSTCAATADIDSPKSSEHSTCVTPDFSAASKVSCSFEVNSGSIDFSFVIKSGDDRISVITARAASDRRKSMHRSQSPSLLRGRPRCRVWRDRAAARARVSTDNHDSAPPPARSDSPRRAPAHCTRHKTARKTTPPNRRRPTPLGSAPRLKQQTTQTTPERNRERPPRRGHPATAGTPPTHWSDRERSNDSAARYHTIDRDSAPTRSRPPDAILWARPRNRRATPSQPTTTASCSPHFVRYILRVVNDTGAIRPAHNSS